MAGAFVGVAEGVECGGLPGAGFADDDGDGVARSGGVLDEVALLVGEVWPGGEGVGDVTLWDGADVSVEPGDGAGGGSGFELQDLGGGVDAGDAFDACGPLRYCSLRRRISSRLAPSSAERATWRMTSRRV